MLFGAFQARNWKKIRRLATAARVRRDALRRGICAPGRGCWCVPSVQEAGRNAPEKKIA